MKTRSSRLFLNSMSLKGGGFAVLALFMGLSACGASEEDAAVGGVTAGEAKALNEAAAILDARANNVAAALRGDGADASAGDDAAQNVAAPAR